MAVAVEQSIGIKTIQPEREAVVLMRENDGIALTTMYVPDGYTVLSNDHIGVVELEREEGFDSKHVVLFDPTIWERPTVTKMTDRFARSGHHEKGPFYRELLTGEVVIAQKI